MEKSVGMALWVLVAVTLACQASAAQIGKGLGVDNMTIAELFDEATFDLIFPNKDNPLLAHAQGFWNYNAFLTAAAMFAKQGFGLVGGSNAQKLEIAAFLAHVSHETSCGWSGSKGGPYAWGLCYNKELSPSSIYCKPSVIYPCVNGVSYHGRGAFPIYYNSNYGPLGVYFGWDSLADPGMIERNATLAFATALYYWMEPQKPNPTPHSAMVGTWKPTKNDTDNFRTPGFGLTINILDGNVECGHGDDIRADDRIGSYQRIADLMGATGFDNNLDCGAQGMLPEGYTVLLKKQ